MPSPLFTIPSVPVMALVLFGPQPAPEAMLIGAVTAAEGECAAALCDRSFFDREAREALRAGDIDGVCASGVRAGGKYGGVAGGPSRWKSDACGIGVPIVSDQFHVPVGVVLPAPARLTTSTSQYLVCAWTAVVPVAITSSSETSKAQIASAETRCTKATPVAFSQRDVLVV